jgi:hypothetical protein
VDELLGHPISSMNLFQQRRLQSLKRKEIAKVDERDRARRVGGLLDGTNHNYRIIKVIMMSKRTDICHLRVLSLLSKAFLIQPINSESSTPTPFLFLKISIYGGTSTSDG